jgi:regulator of RNase E activity RraB
MCRINDAVASVMVDLGLRDQAPVGMKPWLLWIWIQMLSPRPDGLSSSAEAPRLYEVEDALELRLGQSVGAVFCGRITIEDRREFYFYGDGSGRFEPEVRETMEKFPEYKFDFGVKNDPAWSQYREVLYPGPYDLERIKNGDLLAVLTAKGDNHSIPRRVMHWAYFLSSEDRSLFAKAAVDSGYNVDSEYEVEGDRRFATSVYRVQSIEQNNIDETTIELFHLAENLNGSYDGWETQVTTD